MSRRQFFGVYAVSAFNPVTRKPLGQPVKVLGNANISQQGEIKTNTGGASQHPYGAEDGLIETEITLNLKEFPDFIFEALTGATITKNNAETSGAISEDLKNRSGSSVFKSDTGIASATLKSGAAADLKTGKYTIVAVSGTTVDVYVDSDIDFNSGTSVSYADENGKVNSTPLTITQSAATELEGFGIELNGGSGTISMTEGDTATFEVRPPNLGSTKIDIGATTSRIPEIGLVIIGQERSTKQLNKVTVYRCKGAGLPLGMTAKEWASADVTLKAYLDENEDKIYTVDLIDKA